MHNVLKRIFEYLRLRSNILSYYCGWIYYLIIAVEYFLLLLQWNVIFCYYGKYFILLLQFSAHVGRNTKSVHQNSTRAYSKFIKEYNSCTIYIYLYKYIYIVTQQCMIVLAPSIDPLWCREVPGSQTAVRLIAEQKKKTELTTNVSCDCTQRNRN